MTHTTEQLQAMEDLQINEAVAKKLGMTIKNYCGDAVMCGLEGLRSTFADRDYCNNPSDIMPLAFERDITWVKSHERAYHHLSDGVYGFDHGETYDDANPYRAIACLLLLMAE